MLHTSGHTLKRQRARRSGLESIRGFDYLLLLIGIPMQEWAASEPPPCDDTYSP